MSQGPPVGPVVVGVGVPVQALPTGVPPVPEPAPPEPPVADAPASVASEVTLQPKEDVATTAASESAFQKLLVVIWIGSIVRKDESCYGKFPRPSEFVPATPWSKRAG